MKTIPYLCYSDILHLGVLYWLGFLWEGFSNLKQLPLYSYRSEIFSGGMKPLDMLYNYSYLLHSVRDNHLYITNEVIFIIIFSNSHFPYCIIQVSIFDIMCNHSIHFIQHLSISITLQL